MRQTGPGGDYLFRALFDTKLGSQSAVRVRIREERGGNHSDKHHGDLSQWAAGEEEKWARKKARRQEEEDEDEQEECRSSVALKPVAPPARRTRAGESMPPPPRPRRFAQRPQKRKAAEDEEFVPNDEWLKGPAALPQPSQGYAAHRRSKRQRLHEAQPSAAESIIASQMSEPPSKQSRLAPSRAESSIVVNLTDEVPAEDEELEADEIEEGFERELAAANGEEGAAPLYRLEDFVGPPMPKRNSIDEIFEEVDEGAD